MQETPIHRMTGPPAMIKWNEDCVYLLLGVVFIGVDQLQTSAHVK